jgi:hypothetical protein
MTANVVGQHEVAAGEIVRKRQCGGKAHDAAHAGPAHHNRDGQRWVRVAATQRWVQSARQIGREQNPDETRHDHRSDDDGHWE